MTSDAVALRGWRYESAEVTYDRKTIMVGGPVFFVLTGAFSALRNRNARRNAETEAAPRWRPLGPLTVLPTTHRLLVWHQNAWWSVWYSAVAQATCDGSQLQLHFLDAAAPYLFVGDLRALAGAISKSLCELRDDAVASRRDGRHATYGPARQRDPSSALG